MKLSELHSSEVGDTNGVSVVGVREPGPKNVSRPSPIALGSVSKARVGARVLVRLGRPVDAKHFAIIVTKKGKQQCHAPLTKCWS